MALRWHFGGKERRCLIVVDLIEEKVEMLLSIRLSRDSLKTKVTFSRNSQLTIMTHNLINP